MGYTIEAGETPSAAIKRIAKEKLDYAAAQLKGEGYENREEAIHEARKAFKQLRAVIRLVRYQIGNDAYDLENATYRQAGQLLAPMRDSYARIEAIDALIKAMDDATLIKAARTIRRQLAKEYQSVKRSFLKTDEPIQQVISLIEESQARVGDWSIKRDDFRAFKKSIKKVYKRGQKAMSTSHNNTPDAELFHDWRKRVKYLMYQTRILTPLWESVLAPYGEELDKLSEHLGNAHDFALLYDYLIEYEAFQTGDERHVLAQLDHQRAQLEQASEPLGIRIYAESKNDFANRLEEYWNAWQTAHAQSS